MPLLQLNKIQLHYGPSVILDEVDFSIESRERLALVGRNGAGKSTLLKIIMGEISADGGEIQRESDCRITRLEQDVPQDLRG